MTFPEWMTQVERSGASIDGVDLNWLQQQYHSQQQPSLIAQMIVAGHAPRPMAQQPMMQQMPMMQPMPMYQPMYQQPAPKPKGGGFGTFMNIFMGILGFVAIIGGIIWGLMILSKKNDEMSKTRHMTIEGGSEISNYEPPPPEVLKAKNLDPNVSYPYWPIVYDMSGMTAAPDVIFGKLTNYGDKSVKNVTIHFGLYNANKDKVGMAEDTISVLEPGATWEYRAKVVHNYEKAQLDDITFAK